jgi:hypothetical protein
MMPIPSLCKNELNHLVNLVKSREIIEKESRKINDSSLVNEDNGKYRTIRSAYTTGKRQFKLVQISDTSITQKEKYDKSSVAIPP